MNNPEKERRILSQAGLLESAIRTISQLASSADLNTRNLAMRALSQVKQARKLVPARRKDDSK